MPDGRTLYDHLVEVCEDVKGVFNTKVRATPARVTPLTLEVNENIWHDPGNALGPRLHTPVKQAEIAKQVNKMKPLGVIADSQAAYYSQVHLTPKPNPGEWRFCIDYRRLNSATTSMGWPLPNIADMLRRLGEKKAIFFANLISQQDITRLRYTRTHNITRPSKQLLVCINGCEYLWALKEPRVIFSASCSLKYCKN
jgi:hypothetical protein